jgi:hypothetical protein
MEELRAFNFDEGTTLALLVTVPEGGLVSVNTEKMRSRLTDDKGTDLTAARAAFGMHLQMPPQISPEGKACLIEVSGQRAPAKGAAALTAAGTIYLQCGSRQESARQANVPLKPGTKIAAGPIPFEISKVGKPEFSFEFPGMSNQRGPTPPAEKFEVTLLAHQDCSKIASIAFLDAAGKDLGAKPGSSSSMGMGGMMTVEKSFILAKKVDTATILVTYWADLKEVAVPFDVKATLGL